MPRARPRGIMVTLWTGVGVIQCFCHHRVAGFMISRIPPFDFRHHDRTPFHAHQHFGPWPFQNLPYPPAFSRHGLQTWAASFTRFARSAPENPGEPLASMAASTSSDRGTLRMWTFSICSRPRISGSGTYTWRSNRPGLSSAGSSTSGRFGGGNHYHPFIYLQNHPTQPGAGSGSARVHHARQPRPAPRWRPTASISSIKMIHGAWFFGLVEHIAHSRSADTDKHFHKI